MAEMPSCETFLAPPVRRCSVNADAYVRRLKGASRSYGAAYLAWLRGQGPEPAGGGERWRTLAALKWEKRSAIREALHARCKV